MDFSSVHRALDGLLRRQPPLDDHILEDARLLLSSPPGDDCCAALERLATSGSPRWEPLAVAIFVATRALQKNQKVYIEGPRVPDAKEEEQNHVHLDSEQQQQRVAFLLHSIALQHLEHKEPRIRTLVAKAVAAYATEGYMKTQTQTLQNQLVRSIRNHIETGRDESNKNYSKSSDGALDDTTGWRALETNWQCLASLWSTAAPDLTSLEHTLEDSFWQDIEFSSTVHVNRHVRAAGMAVLEQLIVQSQKDVVSDPSTPLRKTLKNVLKAGLADNWSQVRMAASVLCRTLLTTLQKYQAPLDELFPVILPRMCFNRFYLAQGVKLYSHETWHMVFADGSGLPTVCQYLPAVIRYYCQMCDADNHVVREGACQAIAELAVKVTTDDVLRPHIEVLLQSLLMCFHDESWPVRDEACSACGILAKAYPEECRVELKTLWERWTEQLTDQIWSVRQVAAVALGDALEAYGNEFLQELLQLVHKLMPSARDQPSMTMEEYKAHVNDIQAHTDSQLYSCGSLAPKLRKGGAGRIGCSNCGINRPKAPWEATDGCIYLIRELVLKCSGEDSPTPLSDDQLVELLKELVDVCRVQHFPQSSDLRATLWRQVPVMAHHVGKERFKRKYLDIFMDLLFLNLDSRTASQLSIHAAGQCVDELAQLVGPNIFRGRLDDFQRETYDQVMRERRMMPSGPVDEGTFSPFGPPGLLDGIQGRVPTAATPL